MNKWVNGPVEEECDTLFITWAILSVWRNFSPCLVFEKFWFWTGYDSDNFFSFLMHLACTGPRTLSRLKIIGRCVPRCKTAGACVVTLTSIYCLPLMTRCLIKQAWINKNYTFATNKSKAYNTRFNRNSPNTFRFYMREKPTNAPVIHSVY
jgi:hypothetical protein